MTVSTNFASRHSKSVAVLSPICDLSTREPQHLWLALITFRLMRAIQPASRHSSLYQAFLQLAGPYLVWTCDNLVQWQGTAIKRTECRHWTRKSVTAFMAAKRPSGECTALALPGGNGGWDFDFPDFVTKSCASGAPALFRDIKATLDVLLNPVEWEHVELADYLAPAHRNRAVWRALIDPAIPRLEAACQLVEPLSSQNVRFLQELLGLSSEEANLLKFAAFGSNDRNFRALTDEIPIRNHAEGYLLALEAMVASGANAHARIPSGLTRLHRFGLLDVRVSCQDLDDLLRLEDYAADLLLGQHQSATELARGFLKEAPQSGLTTDDCPHLHSELSLASAVLQQNKQQPARGINILLYGPPGTGKTEFARLLAGQCGKTLYEASFNKQKEDEPPKFTQRFALLRMAQHFLGNRPDTLLVFDEAEDAFPDEGLGRGSGRAVPKAWMNELLETNAVPVIWISNAIESMDRAYLRRFALHIEFTPQPLEVRRRIVERHLGGVVSDTRTLDAIAGIEALAPAQVEMAARVIALSGIEDPAERARIATRQIRMACRAMDIDTSTGPLPHATRYDPAFVNLNGDFTTGEILHAFGKRGRGTACFYGPSGTGKTALARHLAERLGRRLILRTASDLLNPYVGMTEKLIRRMFEEAEDTASPAVLLLDEADSFLGDRRNAVRSWEISHTNEFLARMEAFSGIFICTTNLFDTLDPATLRRFTFKLEFNPLDARQRIAIFESEFGPVRDEETRRLVQSLEGLTPGDFAVVARQAALRDAPPPHLAIAGSLRSELAARGPQRRAIGFV